MQQFIEKYAVEILGSLSGFDRLVFRATLRLQITHRDENRKILVAKGMEEYLWPHFTTVVLTQIYSY